MDEDAGPGFWEEEAARHERMAAWAVSSEQPRRWPPTVDTPEACARRHRQSAERCRRVAAAMRGGQK